jgi:hypothetical protein
MTGRPRQQQQVSVQLAEIGHSPLRAPTARLRRFQTFAGSRFYQRIGPNAIIRRGAVCPIRRCNTPLVRSAGWFPL